LRGERDQTYERDILAVTYTVKKTRRKEENRKGHEGPTWHKGLIVKKMGKWSFDPQKRKGNENTEKRCGKRRTGRRRGRNCLAFKRNAIRKTREDMRGGIWESIAIVPVKRQSKQRYSVATTWKTRPKKPSSEKKNPSAGGLVKRKAGERPQQKRTDQAGGGTQKRSITTCCYPCVRGVERSEVKKGRNRGRNYTIEQLEQCHEKKNALRREKGKSSSRGKK